AACRRGGGSGDPAPSRAEGRALGRVRAVVAGAESRAHSLLELRELRGILELAGERFDELGDIARGRALLAEHDARHGPEIFGALGRDDGAALGERLVDRPRFRFIAVGDPAVGPLQLRQEIRRRWQAWLWVLRRKPVGEADTALLNLLNRCQRRRTGLVAEADGDDRAVLKREPNAVVIRGRDEDAAGSPLLAKAAQLADQLAVRDVAVGISHRSVMRVWPVVHERVGAGWRAGPPTCERWSGPPTCDR